ncbi:MAG: hypothetical protein FJ395_09425 [Verrucomicrobia bacterium]|nr:hypothetical protein [Verrucomicrobiota bacterium]
MTVRIAAILPLLISFLFMHTVFAAAEVSNLPPKNAPILVRLSAEGGDRATAYSMSAKVVRRNGHYLCTFLDSARQNRWLLVDGRSGRVLHSGTVGPPQVDNHCGAAVCGAPDGTVHLVIGSHHGSFQHFELPPSSNPDAWRLNDAKLGEGATYPSLVCDSAGTLHLAYRCRGFRGQTVPYHLMYAHRPQGGPWSVPRPLVRAAVMEHTWLTNVLEAGPDGAVHLVFSNTRKLSDGGYYYGASHLFTTDGGKTWRQLGAGHVSHLPVDAAGLKLIEGSEPCAARSQPKTHERWLAQTQRGPEYYYYNEMVVSNPAVDKAGRPWVILHNLLTGKAELRRGGTDGWRAFPLCDALAKAFPGCKVSHAGQLAFCSGGSLEVILTMVPAASVSAWGHPETRLVRIELNADGDVLRAGAVSDPMPGVPDWMPSIERRAAGVAVARPALLFTRGLNAGGFAKNKNEIKTQVWLQLHP